MQFFTLATATFFVSFAMGQTVEWTDVPNICRPACAYTINLSQACVHNMNDEYLDCVCDKDPAPAWIPNCEACVAAFWKSENDVKSLVDACSFTTTTWTGVTTATGSETAAATGDASTTGGSASTATATSTAASSGATSVRTSTRTAISTASSTTSSSASEATGGAASAATAGIGMAAVLMALPALL